MQTFYITFPWLIGILGLIVGSFLNVVVLRHGKKTVGGRSECMSCHSQLKWYELFPVASYVAQYGKCRSCKKSISPQYPLVEFFTGLLFYFGAVHFVQYFPDFSLFGIVVLVALLAILAFIMLLVVYDIKYQLVPHAWLSGLVISSILYLVFWYLPSGFAFGNILLFHVAGIIIALPFLFLWLISKGKWMGFGDILLIAWLGIFFGVWMGLTAVLIAIYMGGLFGIGTILWKRYKKIPYREIRKLRIPFVPFLLIAWVCVELLGITLFAWFI